MSLLDKAKRYKFVCFSEFEEKKHNLIFIFDVVAK
jgi:hypothetical protein